MNSKDVIKKLALEEFDEVGFASLTDFDAIARYETWLLKGRHAQMHYLERHLEQKRDPQKLLANAKSWIVFLSHYDTKEPLSIEQNLKNNQGWIARYARGEDYHSKLKSKLDQLILALKPLFPNDGFLPMVDSAPVMERDIAARSGLGWIGKNSCLINSTKGSFFFICEILTTLKLDSDGVTLDHCGACTKCIDACPTSAITSERSIDSNQCISCGTIEAKEEIPKPIQSQLRGNLFGCDICQDVCPWNHKARRTLDLPEPNTLGLTNLKALVKKTDQEIKTEFKNSSVSRTKPAHLKETARTLLQNNQLTDV